GGRRAEVPRARYVPAAIPGTAGACQPVPLGRLLVRPAEPVSREQPVENLPVPVGAGGPNSQNRLRCVGPPLALRTMRDEPPYFTDPWGWMIRGGGGGGVICGGREESLNSDEALTTSGRMGNAGF